MRIIETVDLSTNSYTRKSVTLVEEFGMYTVITCTKNLKYSGSKSIHHTHPTMDFELAQMLYEDTKKA